MISLEGKKWSEVKELLEDNTTVDRDNTDNLTGKCIVDFVGDFSDFSVIGKIVELAEETIIEIADDAIIYKNN